MNYGKKNALNRNLDRFIEKYRKKEKYYATTLVWFENLESSYIFKSFSRKENQELFYLKSFMCRAEYHRSFYSFEVSDGFIPWNSFDLQYDWCFPGCCMKRCHLVHLPKCSPGNNRGTTTSKSNRSRSTSVSVSVIESVERMRIEFRLQLGLWCRHLKESCNQYSQCKSLIA